MADLDAPASGQLGDVNGLAPRGRVRKLLPYALLYSRIAEKGYLLGNSSLRLGCNRSGFFLSVVFIAKPASRQDDEQQRHYSGADQQR